MVVSVKTLPSIDRLEKLLICDAQNGKLFWRARSEEEFEGKSRPAEWCCRVWNARYAGKEAFTAVNNRGYNFGSFDRDQYLAHRVIWKMHTRKDPPTLDHVNGDRVDNRIENLREASAEENMRNRKNISANRYKGVHQKSSQHWCAVIGKDKIYGFSSDVEAARAYDAEALKRYGEFARINFPEEAVA
jgi:hypothetical protein